GVVLGGGEGAHARLEGLGGPAEPLEVEAGELDLAPGAALALREIAVLGDDLRGRLVLARPDQEPRERAHGVAAGRERDDVAEERDGLAGIPEDLLLERGPLLEDLGAGLSLDLLGAEREEPAEVVLAAVGAEERVERLDRLGVARVGLHEL